MAENKVKQVEFDGQVLERPWDESGAVMDWTAFPHGYGALLNQRYQFPMDLALWQMKIDRSRQLFVDDHVVAHKEGIVRETHSTKDHPGNPIFNPYSQYAVYVSPDPEHGYRLYYNSAGWLLHVAYSRDGLNWEMPELGITDLATLPEGRFPGGPNNVIGSQQMHGLFHEPNDPDPSQRWKAIILGAASKRIPPIIAADRPELYIHQPWPNKKVRGADERVGRPYELFTSGDGLHWSRKAETPLWLGPCCDFNAPHQFPISGSDTLKVRWDPKLKKYIANTKHRIGPDYRLSPLFHAARVVGQCESDDLIHWSPPRIYAYPDGEDAKIFGMHGIYEADGYPYESMWFNNLNMTVYMPATEKQTREKNLIPNRPYLKRNCIRLGASRDGRHWYYVGDRKPFIDLGPEGSWNPHYIRMLNLVNIGGPIVKDDELWFYYRCGNIDGPKSDWHYAMGLATLRRDGFASLNADKDGGLVITRPMVFEGEGKLHVNADVAKNGSLKAWVMGEQGEPIEGFGKDDCPAICKDATKIPVGWGSNETLAKLKDRYIRLAFSLKNAKLYSFWIE